MPKSLHLIHAGKKKRGDLRRQKPAPTLAEIRRKIVLPFTPDHITTKQLEEGFLQLEGR